MVSPNLNGNGAAADESVVRPGSERDVPADAGGQSVPEFDDDLVDDLESSDLPSLDFEGQDESDLDEGDEAGDSKPARHTDDEWAEIMLRDGPQRFAEVPRRLQSAVATKYGDLRARQAAQDAQTVVSDYFSRLRRAQDAVARVDDHFADDPDGKLAWIESGADGSDTYVQLRKWVRQANEQPQSEQVAQVQALQQRAQAQYARLADFPEQQAELQRRASEQRYGQSDEGVALLQSDVDALLREGVEAQLGGKANPKQLRASARRVAAEERGTMPRPDGSGGRAGRSPLTLNKLRTMTREEVMRIPKADLDRVLASG